MGSWTLTFFRRKMFLINWPGGTRYSCLLNSLLVFTLVFARTRGALSHLNSSIYRPLASTEELVLPRHARCMLSRLHCNGPSLPLNFYLFIIGRIGNPSCSACSHQTHDTSHLILHCPATGSLGTLFGDSLSLYDLWFRPWAVVHLLILHGLSPCLHLSEGVR